MKTAISIPDRVFDAAERLAGQLEISRSQLYTEAIGALLEAHRYSGVTEQLDALYKVTPELGGLDKTLEEIQSRSLDEEDW